MFRIYYGTVEGGGRRILPDMESVIFFFTSGTNFKTGVL